ncbi:shikimate/quinate 5-dehydrogenase [Thermoanaerobacter ethanolicus JW 200]|nr:shikimate/quinate 5-dehydrogenase [Thermoanaerobacter ethanolicus JW 200]
MHKFGFIIHPIEYEDVSRKFKIMEKFPKRVVEGFTRLLPPMKVSEITGVKSEYV